MNKKNIICRVCCFQLCVLTYCTIGLQMTYGKRVGLTWITTKCTHSS